MNENEVKLRLYYEKNYETKHTFLLKHPYYLLWWMISKVYQITLIILLLPFTVVLFIILVLSVLFEKIGDFLYLIQEIFGSCIQSVMSALYYRRVNPRMNRIFDRIIEKEMTKNKTQKGGDEDE